MTIYNKELTSKLESLFTDTVFSWTKNKIRNELEEAVVKTHNIAVGNGSKATRNKAFEVFREIKDVDDAFMTLYMRELDEAV